MPILHTVSRSPYRETTLDSCLRVALPGSALLLMEDGVYAALAAGQAAPAIRKALAHMRVFALQADLSARGLAGAELVDEVQVVDYPGFVDLACEYDKVQAWV
jgi:tRNA 2-thiouridine synthesizing protein B